jgi:hypothetical protein
MILRRVICCAYNGYFATVYAFSAEVLTVLGTRCLMVIRITMLKQQCHALLSTPLLRLIQRRFDCLLGSRAKRPVHACKIFALLVRAADIVSDSPFRAPQHMSSQFGIF